MSKINPPQRLEEIDVLKGWGILLVVMGHSLTPDMSLPEFFTLLLQWIYSFHMPLFMAISGFLFNYQGKKYSYKDFVQNKIKRLLLPYGILSLIAFFPKTLLSEYSLRPLGLGISGFIKSILYPWDNPIIAFWFLPTLFIIFLLEPVWKKLSRSTFSIQAVVTLILVVLYMLQPIKDVGFLNLAGVSDYLFFFWLGCLLGHYRQSMHSWLNQNNVFYALLAGTFILNFFWENGRIVHFLAAIIGILMSISLTKCASRYIQLGAWFKPLGYYSYQIYLLSWFPQTFVIILSHRILHWPFFITALAMLASGIFVPILCAQWLQRYPRLRFVIGL